MPWPPGPGCSRAPRRDDEDELHDRGTAGSSAPVGLPSLAELPDHCAAALEALQGTGEDDEALRAAYQASSASARALTARLTRLAERAGQLADAMDVTLVYDASRRLFSIGFNVTTAALDNSYYDLLASEARLASLVAIAQDAVPQAHWFHLGRQLAPAAGGRALLSWSGTMFEYLMPLLVMRTLPADAAGRDLPGGHRPPDRVRRPARGVPWGISESAYNTLDLALNYQYRAFGVPGLGLKPGLADDLVIAPYATVLALIVDPAAAARQPARPGARGAGWPLRLLRIDRLHRRAGAAGRRAVIVRAFMAHHQGMSLVAMDNLVHGEPMVRRFHAEPRIRATELLLQERVPGAVRCSRSAAEDDDAPGDQGAGRTKGRPSGAGSSTRRSPARCSCRTAPTRSW